MTTLHCIYMAVLAFLFIGVIVGAVLGRTRR